MFFRQFASRTVCVFVVVLGIFIGGRTAVADPVTDIVFLIDATGSMSGEIAGVRAGFAGFVADLNSQAVDARYAIILFGGEPELVLDFTSDATATQTALNTIAIGAVAGFQENHNVNPEAGLEAIRMALGAAEI